MEEIFRTEEREKRWFGDSADLRPATLLQSGKSSEGAEPRERSELRLKRQM